MRCYFEGLHDRFLTSDVDCLFVAETFFIFYVLAETRGIGDVG